MIRRISAVAVRPHNVRLNHLHGGIGEDVIDLAARPLTLPRVKSPHLAGRAAFLNLFDMV